MSDVIPPKPLRTYVRSSIFIIFSFEQKFLRKINNLHHFLTFVLFHLIPYYSVKNGTEIYSQSS